MYSNGYCLQAPFFSNSVHCIFSILVLLSDASNQRQKPWGLHKRNIDQAMAYSDSELEIVASRATDKLCFCPCQTLGALGEHVWPNFQCIPIIYDLCGR